MQFFDDTRKVTLKLGVHLSFFKYFHKDPVNLIFAENQAQTTPIIECKEEFTEDTLKCDLTGSPLKTDLGEDENSIIYFINTENSAQMGKPEELNYYPLPLNTARQELNKILMNRSAQCSSVFVLCNGDDKKQTVALGANPKQRITYSIHVLGTILCNKIEERIASFRTDHLNYYFPNKKINRQVECFVQATYNIFGRSLENMKDIKTMKQVSTGGHIYIDITSRNSSFKLFNEDIDNIKMHVSILAGHPLLKLHFLYEDLTQLHELHELFQKQEMVNDETEISDKPLNEDDILQQLTEVASSSLVETAPKKDIDSDDLRYYDLLDKLWILLKNCKNASVLKNCFLFLFEQLIDGAKTELQLEDDFTKVGKIVREILRGKMKIPRISLCESLEFLFELGARKLKLDFKSVFSQYQKPRDKNLIDTTWSSLESDDLKANQMLYLSQLYISSEFINLVKMQVYVNDETLALTTPIFLRVLYIPNT
ncbi:hypothetical protein ABEB36_005860 [Hypothenemus hampei]|uniref:Protein zwilch n=1 Tax=Hypothenemus hampei TaxID=57062 RepID=A0ABD1F0W8_HYPHA